jgi:hypothetical protein
MAVYPTILLILLVGPAFATWLLLAMFEPSITQVLTSPLVRQRPLTYGYEKHDRFTHHWACNICIHNIYPHGLERGRQQWSISANPSVVLPSLPSRPFVLARAMTKPSRLCCLELTQDLQETCTSSVPSKQLMELDGWSAKRGPAILPSPASEPGCTLPK